MREKYQYKEGDRVEYMARIKYKGVNSMQHRIGFIKRAEKSIWGVRRYFICVADKELRTIDVVPEYNIFGIVEKKDKQPINK